MLARRLITIYDFFRYGLTISQTGLREQYQKQPIWPKSQKLTIIFP